MAKSKKKNTNDPAVFDLRKVADAAEKYKALGDPTRLGILQILLQCEEQAASNNEAAGNQTTGVTIGEIARFLTGDTEISSTLSHHLKELRHAGLVAVERDGKNKRCRVVPEALASLAALLTVKNPSVEPVIAPASMDASPEQKDDTAPAPEVVIRPVTVVPEPDTAAGKTRNRNGSRRKPPESPSTGDDPAA